MLLMKYTVDTNIGTCSTVDEVGTRYNFVWNMPMQFLEIFSFKLLYIVFTYTNKVKTM